MDDACSSTSMNNNQALHPPANEDFIAVQSTEKRPRPAADDVDLLHPVKSSPSEQNLNGSKFSPEVQIPNSTAEMFFRTKLCTKFMRNACPYGANCTFAHGQEELRLPPPNWQEEVALHRSEYQQKMLQKNKICNIFAATGKCSYGSTCIFVHETPPPISGGRGREGSAMTDVGSKVKDKTGEDCVVLAGGFGRNTAYNDQPINLRSEMWKTKMCHKWELTGSCPFGNDCSFAHGVEDLKKIGDNIDAAGANQMAPANAVPDAADNKELPNQITTQEDSAEDYQPKVAGFPKLLDKWGYKIRKISGIYGDWINEES